MYELTEQDQAVIDEQLQGKMEWAEANRLEAEQLALDATRLLSCTEDRLELYRNQGFFKRCWYSLSGKNEEMQKANQRDLVSMQQYAWRYINLLNDRNILMAHSMITVKNNLMTLAVAEEETRNEVRRMADKVYNRFVELEDRMQAVEVATSIHGWLITLDTLDYDDRFTPHFRLLRVVNDFIALKSGDWNIQELRYLQKAVKAVDLPWKDSVSVEAFVDGVIDEIESSGYENFNILLGGISAQVVPAPFILENVAVPTYTALFCIADNYSKSADTIDVLIDQLNCSRIEAIKKVLMTFIARQGVDVSAEVPLRDLAIELLSCMRLSRELYGRGETKSEVPAETSTTSAEEQDNSGDVKNELLSEGRELLPKWSDLVGGQMASLALKDLSDKIDEYIDDDEMGLEEFALYFNVEGAEKWISEGLNNVCLDVLNPFDQTADYGFVYSGESLEVAFAEKCRSLMEDYLESVAEIEKAATALLADNGKEKSQPAKGNKRVGAVASSGATAVAVGTGASSAAGIAAGAAALLTGVGAIALAGAAGVVGAKHLHKRIKQAQADKKVLAAFNQSVQESFNRYSDLLENLGAFGGELFLQFKTEAIQFCEDKDDITDLEDIVIGMRKVIELAEPAELTDPE